MNPAESSLENMNPAPETAPTATDSSKPAQTFVDTILIRFKYDSSLENVDPAESSLENMNPAPETAPTARQTAANLSKRLWQMFVAR